MSKLHLLPVAALLLLAAEPPPVDLGLLTDRRGFVLTPAGRSDVLRFEVTAHPAALTNRVTFTLTNRLVQTSDLPLPNGPGLLAIQTLWQDGSLSRPALYHYDLFRGDTEGPAAQAVGILKPDQTGVVERAVARARRPPVVTLPPLPPTLVVERVVRPPTPLPDAAPPGMRHYYERARRDGVTLTNERAPRSQIRRLR